MFMTCALQIWSLHNNGMEWYLHKYITKILRKLWEPIMEADVWRPRKYRAYETMGKQNIVGQMKTLKQTG